MIFKIHLANNNYTYFKSNNLFIIVGFVQGYSAVYWQISEWVAYYLWLKKKKNRNRIPQLRQIVFCKFSIMGNGFVAKDKCGPTLTSLDDKML